MTNIKFRSSLAVVTGFAVTVTSESFESWLVFTKILSFETRKQPPETVTQYPRVDFAPALRLTPLRNSEYKISNVFFNCDEHRTSSLQCYD